REFQVDDRGIARQAGEEALVDEVAREAEPLLVERQRLVQLLDEELRSRRGYRSHRSTSSLGSAAGHGLVQGHGLLNQGLERLLVDLLALVEVDGAPRVPLEAGVEDLRGILQGRAPGEGQLDDLLVDLARAEDPVMRPHRNAPLPLLDDVGIRRPDQRAEPCERLASPVVELLDPRVDQLGGSLALRPWALLHHGYHRPSSITGEPESSS